MLVSIKICNCIHISNVISYYIPPKFCKEKEPKDEQLCIGVHTINNIHDAMDSKTTIQCSKLIQLEIQYSCMASIMQKH